MNIDVVVNWLKNTVLGIILLGATGSLLAALLVWLVNRFVLPWFAKGHQIFYRNAFRRGYVQGHMVGTMIREKDAVALTSYLAFRLLRIGVWGVISLVLLIGLLSFVNSFGVVFPKVALAVLSGCTSFAFTTFLLGAFDLGKACKWGFEAHVEAAREAYAKTLEEGAGTPS